MVEQWRVMNLRLLSMFFVSKGIFTPEQYKEKTSTNKKIVIEQSPAGPQRKYKTPRQRQDNYKTKVISQWNENHSEDNKFVLFF